METRYAVHPEDFLHYDTAKIRREFLIEDLFLPDRLKLVYSHTDRMLVGGVCPIKPVDLIASKELGADYFLDRRELGVINVGPAGTVTVDGKAYNLATGDGLYIGQGAREVSFASAAPDAPARFYFNSAPAHMQYPTVKIGRAEAMATHLGSSAESNERTIRKYIHPDGAKSCQLVMGLTELEPGCVWNSMPCHTHERRMEVYFYFNLPPEAVLFHMMGMPEETRHIIVRNEQAVIAPSWSIHCGAGTTRYAFIWGMAGENQVFADMDGVKMGDLR